MPGAFDKVRELSAADILNLKEDKDVHHFYLTAVVQMIEALDKRDEELTKLNAVMETLHKDIAEAVNKLASAVPDGDYKAHCDYHAELIEQARQRTKLRQAIIEKSLTGLVWTVGTGFALGAWNLFKMFVSRGGTI